ncbi:hypothetical protein [Fibrobacter sp.]|uniref:hypothetical protein n=1 Tax=Fibrobacter sp. TaxID=35828 RepID=UPI00388DD1C1
MTKTKNKPDDKHDTLIQAVATRYLELKELLARIPEAAKQAGSTNGGNKSGSKGSAKADQKLRVSMNHGRPQYYITRSEPGTSSTRKAPVNGKFVPKAEIKKAIAIAQRDYNSATAEVISKQIAALDRLLAEYRPNTLDETFTQLHPGRRALVTPVREPDADFVASWQHTPYTSKPFEINAPEYFTSTGVRVRSKSEVIIADALSRAGIPFHYEYPTSIKSWGTLYPDFTCLDIRTRKEIIWEHFGLMGDPDYTENTVQKIAHYATSGYTLGKNLIATFESATTPLSVKQVQQYIKTFFTE